MKLTKKDMTMFTLFGITLTALGNIKIPPADYRDTLYLFLAIAFFFLGAWYKITGEE